MDGVKTYRFPTITATQIGPAVPKVNSLQTRVPKVSSCVIDAPRDDVRSYREHLLTFQKQNRGVKGQGGSLPNIPFRLRSHATSSEAQGDGSAGSSDVGFPFLESYMNNSFCDHSLIGQLRRTRTTLSSDTVAPAPKESATDSKGINMPFAKSLRLFSRERKPMGRPGVGSVSERLPRVGAQAEGLIDSALKKVPGLFDSCDAENVRPVSPESDEESAMVVDIHSDRIGPTSHASVDSRKTLADILNRRNNVKYPNIPERFCESNQSKTHNKQTFNPEPGADRYWVNKFDTKLVDRNSYDNFARTRKPDPDKEGHSRTDSKSVKRVYTHRSSDVDQVTVMTVSHREDSFIKKSGRKYTKLRIALTNSNNRSAE